MSFNKNVLCLLGFILMFASCNQIKKQEAPVKKKKPNILFIAVDDLRPELGCYGSNIAITPNFDRIAKQGVLFERAYCQQAICSPSRASLMTGARPETINIIENFTYFRDENPDIITLPQHFIANGYEAAYAGKIYHKSAFADQQKSWSRTPAKIELPRPNYPGGYTTKENQDIYKKNQAFVKSKYKDASHYALGRGPAYEINDVEDHEYNDGYNTLVGIATLKEMIADKDKPFFFGMGYKLPHLDWNAPKKYWDMYDRDKIPMSDQVNSPKDGAAMGLHASFELRVRHGIPKTGPIEGELARTLKHAYLASVSYVDAQIGKVLDALEESGEMDNTIIMLWGDHGWHLGDMGVWGKATNYEIATRVPLIVSSPYMTAEMKGKKSNALVELVDMYPTLCELASIDQPKHLEGHSFAPVLSDASMKWKDAAFTVYPTPALREWAANPLTKGMRETYFGPLIEDVEGRIIAQQGDNWDRELFENNLMGYAMRTDRYRLVVWKDRTKPESEPLYVELYDHTTDPKETTNVAPQQQKIVDQLMIQFNKGWEGSLPKV